LKKALLPLLFALLVSLLLSCLPILAASPAVTLAGSSALRAGDTLTVTLSLSGTGLCAMEGEITYDPAKLTYQSCSVLAGGWSFDEDASSGSVRLLGIDDKMTAPVNAPTRMVSLTFRVSADLAPGTSVKVTASELSATDGEGDFYPDSAVYQTALLPPRSSDASLSGLSAAQTSLTPAFAPDVTEYTAVPVPFAVSSLSLTYQTSDDGAEVSVSGNELTVGENEILLTVTAEDGSKRVYRIRVEREQDPNYQPSSDATLKELSLSVGTLSPAFSPATRAYLVTLPFEVEQITVSGAPSDPKAPGCKVQSLPLAVGVNIMYVVSLAEDGSNCTYTLYLLRMPAFEGTPPTVLPGQIGGEETSGDTDEPSTTPPSTSRPDSAPVTEDESQGGALTDPSETTPTDQTKRQPLLARLTEKSVLIALLITAAVMLGIGLVIGILLARPKRYSYRR